MSFHFGGTAQDHSIILIESLVFLKITFHNIFIFVCVKYIYILEINNKIPNFVT